MQTKNKKSQGHYLTATPKTVYITSFFFEASFLLHVIFYNKMSDERSKYKKILDRKDEEFKRAMEAEVNTPLLSNFSSKCRILVGVDIIAQSQLDFAIFK